MTEDDYILIGQIRGIHGLHGNMKVYSYTETLDLYEKGLTLLIREPSKPGEYHTIKEAKPYKKGVLLSIDGIEDISSAEKLIGSDIWIARDLLPETDDDEYYWFEIIGLSVYTVTGEALGVVKSIFPTGSNDVYVVESKGEERLIPALESVIISIDLDTRTMTVDLPEGL
ncbi:MAG: ribosome maturation factor RimM [Proteobacteria bacterium]|nr:ribosome maturation factor RimM [Pseudomonadota bacterium]